jgi:hypothetical protein
VTAVERPAQPFGPEEHKATAAELGLPNVRELLVLAPGNDPLYKGTEADRRDAEWFADLWQRFGYTRGVHLRRAHYQVLSTGCQTSNGTAYENTEGCWAALCKAAAAARLLGLVDAEAFVDRRNPEPVVNRWPRTEPPEPGWSRLYDFERPSWELPSAEPPELPSGGSWMLPFVPYWALPEIEPQPVYWPRFEPLPDQPGVEVTGYDYGPDDQPVLVEVWIEKSTMQDVLGPLCASLNINLVTGVGNQSITAAVRLLRRAERHGKPAHVLYVSDFDPAGEHMPAAVARQAQFWRDRLDVTEPLTLDPLVLTRGQVAEYALPRVPIKDSDRRAAAFEARNGAGAVELDALEALHPGVLGDLVRQAAEPYVDPSLRTALGDAQRAARDAVAVQWQDDTAGLRDDLTAVEGRAREAIRRHEESLSAAGVDLAAELTPERRELDEMAAEIRAVLAPLVEPFRPRLDAVRVRVNGKVEQHRERLSARADELAAELAPLQERLDELADDAERMADDFDPVLPDRPEPAEPTVDRDRLLYDSRRCWLDQLAAYRRAKGGSA